MVPLNQLLTSWTQGMLKKFPKLNIHPVNNSPEFHIDLVTCLMKNSQSPSSTSPSVSPNKINCGSNQRILMEIMPYGSSGLSLLISFNLWTSTCQAAMQHNIEQIIPTPILTSVTLGLLAFSDQNRRGIMNRRKELSTKKATRGTLTFFLVNVFFKLLLCSIKKVFPVAWTKL